MSIDENFALEVDALDDLEIVDAHHHFCDLDGPICYPWLIRPQASRHGDYSRFCRSYLPEEYKRDTALQKLIASVHVEAECDRTQQVEETQWLTAVHRRHGLPTVIVAHAWVDTPDAEEIVRKQANNPLVRGIRTKPLTSSGPGESVRGEPRSMQDEKWIRGLALLEKYSLSWDLRVPWWHLEEAAEVTRQYPRMPIVLNHAGCPFDRSEEALAVWRKGMHAIADCANVWCKISGLLVTGQPWTLALNGPIIRETIELFGVERCMFASNAFPDTLKGSWDYIYTQFKRCVSHLPRGDHELLFSKNAIRFYRIDGLADRGDAK